MKIIFKLAILVPVISLIFSVVSCDAQNTGKLKRDIPTEKNGKQELFNSISRVCDSLHLKHIENGYDSLELRIWISYGLTHTEQVLIFSNDRGKWQAESIIYAPVLDDYNPKILRGYSKKVSKIYPGSSWDLLLDKIRYYKIPDLPDQEKIPDYNHPHDGNNYAVEYATINEYRLYSYHAPGSNLSIPEAKDMVDFLDFVKKEFNIKLYR